MIDLAYDCIVIISIICAILGVYLFRYSNRKEHFFIYYILVIAIFESIARFCTTVIKVENNLPGLHAFTVIQFIVLSLFINECIKELVDWFNYKWILIIGTLGIIANSLFVQNIYVFNSYSRVFVELYIIVMTIVLFIKFIKDKTHDHAQMKPSVSFVSAIFLQSSVSIIFFLYSTQIMAMKSIYLNIIMNLKLIITFVALFIILFGLWQIHKRRWLLYSETIKI